MDEIIDKYSNIALSNLNKDNMIRIINFLNQEECDYIEDIIEDYLDLFTIDYEDFVKKYNQLNSKYNNNLLNLAAEDMNIFEEFF